MIVLLALVLMAGGDQLASGPSFADQESPITDLSSCDRLGWFPDEFGLKDHTVFWHDGWYYIASIYLGDDDWEDRFVYARSEDLCSWEYLGDILEERTSGWESSAIWAPFVLAEGEVFYMYYTGVAPGGTQSILLASSTDPTTADSWEGQGLIFQPSHESMVWPGLGEWSDCRDPTVRRWGSRYYLYYAGQDEAGGIVGIATSESPGGPWQDWGAILTVPDSMLESPTVTLYDGWYYLMYNRTDGTGEEMRVGPTPSGPWSESRLLRPGWAHEVWKTPDDVWMTSYLTTNQVSIQPVSWDDAHSPPWPFIGERVFHTWMPLVTQAD